MRERADKENGEGLEVYRKRQRSQLAQLDYRHQGVFEMQGNAYPIEKYQPRRRDFADQYDLKHDLKYYGKEQKRQAERYEMVEKVAKFGGYEVHDRYNHHNDNFHDHSFGENSLQSEININNPQQKRQNAKRKGLDIKMSNINCISDKINSLLSMVKKEKNDYSKDDNNSPQRTQSPVIQRAAGQYHFPSDQKAIRSGEKATESQYRGGQRMKTYSAVESKSSNKKNYKQDSGKANRQYNNDQDRYEVYNPSNYHSPSKHHREEAALAYNYEKYEKSPYTAQRNQRANKYPTIQRGREQLLQTSDLRRNIPSTKKTEKTPLKYQETYKESPANRSNSTIQQRNHSRTPTRNLNLDPRYLNTQSTFMPITLLQRQQEQPYEEMRDNLSGIRMIDDKLKRIKEKVNISEHQNRKYQQRLMEGQAGNKPANAGKIYTNDSASKKFQLKLHPVVNDRAETVRIAEKLCYQIEVDSRMRKAREDFCSNDGQQKWKDLETKLAKNGVRVTVLELKQILTPSPDEFSPFGEDSATQSSDLLRAFTQAQKHWQKQVSGCASMKALKTEGFSVGELDLNKKGYLSIEDLVCFVNLYTGHFYKNRDLTIIFRRLILLQRGKSQLGLEYPTFLRAFTL